MKTRGVWLGGSDSSSQWAPCSAWLTEPERPNGLGVVVLPPIGYASSSSHRFWRTLAEHLASGGASVLRVDYWATGDSAGLASEITDFNAWRSSVQLAASFFREKEITSIVLVGCQLGATIAILEGHDIHPKALVTIAPVLSGRRFVRPLSLIGIAAPTEIGGTSLGGHYFSAGVLRDISALNVELPTDIPLLAVPDQPGVAAFMERPAEEATVDSTLVTEIVSWIEALELGKAASPLPAATSEGLGVGSQTATLVHQGVALTEEFVTVGPDQLVGVICSPPGAPTTNGLYVLLNSGSDPHTGPGRAWVELGRHAASAGLSTLRLDWRGWGESPDGPSVPGRPYDQHTIQDLVRAIESLSSDGRRIVLGGLCAGAWIALAASRVVEVAGAVVLNPQLYWQPGDPVEALMTTTRARRLDEIQMIKAEAATGRWDSEDVRGDRPPAGVWIDDLVRLGRRTTLLFAEGDDGLEYLQYRLARRIRTAIQTGLFNVIELPEVDHGLHRTWERQKVFSTIVAEVGEILRDTGKPGAV